jgi:hypothetical protein
VQRVLLVFGCFPQREHVCLRWLGASGAGVAREETDERVEVLIVHAGLAAQEVL